MSNLVTNANTLAAAKKAAKKSLFDFGLVTHPEPITKLIHKQQVQIRPTIPYEEVLDAIQWSINYIVDDRAYISAPLRAIIADIALVKYYSNIDCSEIDSIEFGSNNLYEFYDALTQFNIISTVLEVAQPAQIKFFRDTLEETIHSIVTYRNSAAGIFERLQVQSGEDKNQLTAAMEILKDPNQTGHLQKALEIFNTEQFSEENLAAFGDSPEFQALKDAKFELPSPTESSQGPSEAAVTATQ